MESFENHQITLPKWKQIGFSAFDVVDREEPNYQVRSPYELTNVIFSTDERYSDYFLLHSTVPAHSSEEILQIFYETEDQFYNNPVR